MEYIFIPEKKGCDNRKWWRNEEFKKERKLSAKEWRRGEVLIMSLFIYWKKNM